MEYIKIFFGSILGFLYNIVGNYGVSIILLTFLIKLALSPLDLKQRKSAARMQQIQPVLNQLQKKYANDKEKLNAEIMKVYREYKISPTSGCLPMLLQFPIIIALYWVIRQPITYMMGIDNINDQALLIINFNDWARANTDKLVGTLPELFSQGSGVTGNNYAQYEIQIAQVIHNNADVLKDFIGETAKANGLGAIGSSFEMTTVDFSFLGLNLAETPSIGKLWSFITGGNVKISEVALCIIPLCSGLSSWFSSKLTQVKNTQKVDKNVILPESEKVPEQANPMQSMTIIMPIISAWFTFTFPAALGLYWVVSNVYQIIQISVVNKLVVPKIENEFKGEFIDVKENRKKRKKH
ncbi:MAG: YidC/Oxa1 family membrane protein insertase [Ruminococcaceae bacterium]|nr:YidC/Oxa1 family membrane protein insertase [Oscillospiraceae bacterium]